MVSAFDQRIVQVTIGFPDGPVTFDGLSIYASGRKLMSAIYNECTIRIFNLTQEKRNEILSKATFLTINRVPVPIYLDVGRESYGTFRLYDGFMMVSSTTQPPDIGLVLQSLTSGYTQGTIINPTQSSTTQLSVIAAQVAATNNLTLNFQATDKQIDNYSYNGSAFYQLENLNQIGGIIAFITGGELIVIDSGKAARAGNRILSAATGMVGIPELTWSGLNVKMMIDNTVQLGDNVTIESQQLPVANGTYLVQGIDFDVASRDEQFFYTLSLLSTNGSPYTGTIT